MKFIYVEGLAIPDGGIRAVQLGRLTATVHPTYAKETAETANALAHGPPVSNR